MSASHDTPSSSALSPPSVGRHFQPFASPSSRLSALTTVLALTTLLLPTAVHSINLDIHIPLPSGGCVMAEALRANLLLREASESQTESAEVPEGSRISKNSINLRNSNNLQDLSIFDQNTAEPMEPTEQIDLFLKHTPHVTLFLSDFDLEVDTVPNNDTVGELPLNQTKLQEFLNTLSSINFTDVVKGIDCSLSYTKNTAIATTRTTNNNNNDAAFSSSQPSYYTISGPYTMLPIQSTPCLQTLSSTIYHTLQPFLKHPIQVPSWVASLPEPERSRAIYRCREYGSPNVEEGFVPHVSVGFDPSHDGDGGGGSSSLENGLSNIIEGQQWRVDAMEEWSESHKLIHDECVDPVKGIAVGKTSLGGTVLADSRLGYWELNPKHRRSGFGDKSDGISVE